MVALVSRDVTQTILSMDAKLVLPDAKLHQLLPPILIHVFQIVNVILVLELMKSNAVTTDKNVTGLT